MTGNNGTLFVARYGEELVEPDEWKAKSTGERASAVEAQNASVKTFDTIKEALSAAAQERRAIPLFPQDLPDLTP